MSPVLCTIFIEIVVGYRNIQKVEDMKCAFADDMVVMVKITMVLSWLKFKIHYLKYEKLQYFKYLHYIQLTIKYNQ